ncbi:MAG: hypothetical protein ABEI54_03140 [Candidatus Bipolaricaulia bacterium]
MDTKQMQEAIQGLQQVFQQGQQLSQQLAEAMGGDDQDADDQDESMEGDESMEDEDQEGDEDDYASGEDPYADEDEEADSMGDDDSSEDEDDPYAMDDSEPADDEMPPDEQSQAKPQGDSEDEEYPDDEDNSSQKPLGKRLRDLEQFTGLSKSASSGTAQDRLSELEFEWLGEENSGPARDRVARLEKEAGIQSQSEQSPDVIELDTLLKTTANEAAKRAVQEYEAKSFNKSAGKKRKKKKADPEEDLPDPQTLRKSANRNGKKGSKRKRSAPEVQTDRQLEKKLGVESEDDLEKEISFGDVLMAQYQAQENGESLFSED